MLLKDFYILLLSLAISTNVIAEDQSDNSTDSGPFVSLVFSGGEHLEGPHYSDEENALYFVDTTQQTFHRIELDSGNWTSKYTEYGPVSLIVKVKDYPNLMVVSSKSELFFMPWNTTTNATSLKQLVAVDTDLPENRCNAGKVDAKGRLWFGTMGHIDAETFEMDPNKGTLYMLHRKNYPNPAIKVRSVSISNGIAWSSDNKTMYYADSPTGNISAFDIDMDTAKIKNRRTVFNFAENNITGFPYGLTIDTDDNLWIAVYTAGLVIKINPSTGELLEGFGMPASQITSVGWGDRNLSTLFVTSSTLGLNSTDLDSQPYAGSLFALTNTGSRGYSQHQFVFPNADTI